VLYECLTGRKPYDADTIGDLVYALCSGPPTDIARLRPDLPAPVSRAIMRALSPNRDDRQTGVVELCRELAPFADRSLTGWLNDPPKAPLPEPPQPPASPFKPGGAPTPSGVRPILHSEATQAFPLPEGPVDEPTPAMHVEDSPSEDGGRRDTPTTFFVKGKHPELPERAPDSEKTRMLEPSQGPRQYAIPSEDIDDPPTAPVKPEHLIAAQNAFAPGHNGKYAKTTPLDVSSLPELSALNRQAPPMPAGNSGMFQAPPMPQGPIPGTSGMFQAPPMPQGPIPGTSGVFQPPGLNSPSGMFRPPGGMPGQLLMSQANLPAMNIPGTTGPLPMGGGQPSWMAMPGQGAPPPRAGGLAAFWRNAPPRTQLIIAVGAASGLVAFLLILLWIIVR
jgi:serine/threonine-protein kinase